MNREQTVEKAALALYNGDARMAARYRDQALKVLDAVLPQVTTVAELEALHPDSLVLSDEGGVGSARNWWARSTVERMPLTVIWQPEVTS